MGEASWRRAAQGCSAFRWTARRETGKTRSGAASGVRCGLLSGSRGRRVGCCHPWGPVRAEEPSPTLSECFCPSCLHALKENNGLESPGQWALAHVPLHTRSRPPGRSAPVSSGRGRGCHHSEAGPRRSDTSTAHGKTSPAFTPGHRLVPAPTESVSTGVRGTHPGRT